MSTLFTEYTEHLKEVANDTAFLGALCWYAVPGDTMPHYSKLLELVVEADAPMSIPAPPKAVDVFRRACNEAKRSKVPAPQEGQSFNYLLKDTGCDDLNIYRQLVEERVDGKKHKMGFRTLGRAIALRPPAKIHQSEVQEPVSISWELDIDAYDPSYGTLESIQDEILHFCKTMGSQLTSIAFRETIRASVMKGLSGTAVRPSGGVYFVNIDKLEQLERIQHVVNNIGGSSFHIIPLIDDQIQRRMIKQAFEDETEKAAEKLMIEISGLLASGEPVSASKFHKYNVQLNELRDRMGEYTDILDTSLTKANTSLDLLGKQISELLQKSL